MIRRPVVEAPFHSETLDPYSMIHYGNHYRVNNFLCLSLMNFPHKYVQTFRLFYPASTKHFATFLLPKQIETKKNQRLYQATKKATA